VDIVTIYPEETPQQQEERHGRKLHLFVDGQPECCRLRKEEPFLRHVRDTGLQAIAVGLRRADGERRKQLQPLAPDPRVGGWALNPLVDWTDADLARYLDERQPPVHPLHARSYPSIGCQCCTTPVAPGEPARAGRWRHLRGDDAQPMYCGINFTDGSGI
jgi:phosphoadenosine phosphosulfate reductase